MVREKRRYGLANENGAWVDDVLDVVKGLRLAYRDASRSDMERHARELRSLLSVKTSSAALDKELERRRIVTAAFDNKALIQREVELAESFGYSRGEAKEYVRRARAAVAAGAPVPDVATTAQLLEHLERLHSDAVRDIDANVHLWERRRRRETKRASSAAQDRLFGIGVLVADAARRVLFDLSYALAVTALPEREVDY
jgi:hypothetical protein